MRGLLNSVLASAAAALHGEGKPWGEADGQFRNPNWTPGGAPGLANKGKARWKRLRRVRG